MPIESPCIRSVLIAQTMTGAPIWAPRGSPRGWALKAQALSIAEALEGAHDGYAHRQTILRL
jgi:uncharacterized protein (DUF1800 family)